MSRDARFWRSLAIVGATHLIVLAGLARWSQNARKPLGTDVIWMEGGAQTVAEKLADEADATPADPEEAAPTPEAQPTIAPVAPEAAPVATTTPAPSVTPRPSPAATPKPSPKTKLKPTPTPKKSRAKKSDKPDSAKKSANKKTAAPRSSSVTVAGAPGSGGGQAGGAGSASENARYGSMLHDRFFGGWDQPTSVVGNGAKMSVLVRIRIEKDGRVSDFSLVRPSGNVVVDESVAAIAKRVPQVEPLPPALAGKGHYDVNINFELSAD